jgi:basic membrane protein A
MRAFRYGWLFSFLLALLVSGVGLCADQQATAPLKVGFVMTGAANDLGWNYTHELGRKFLETTLKGKVQTTLAEKVPESAEAERVMEKMIAQGTKLIFATAYGYLEPAERVAARHPDVTIMQCQRSCSKPQKNVGAYFVDPNDPLYVAGVVAGRTTKTGHIGCVAPHPVAIVLTTFNAFALGVHRVNPKAKIQIVWTGSWFDAPLEAEATKGSIDSGADVIFSEMSSALTIVQTAAKNGAHSAGCCVDLKNSAPKSWLTGQCFHWGPLYVKLVESVINHSWKPGDEYYGMKGGYSELSAFGDDVSPKVKLEALDIKRKIESGDIVVFRGPLKDQSGKERVKAGQVLTLKDLANVNWLVQGVDGAIPQK